MNRNQALPYVAHVLDDALNDDHTIADMLPNARLVGWQCGFEPMFIAVQSYLPNTRVDDDDAIEIAMDYLAEKKWFSGEPTEPDHVI